MATNNEYWEKISNFWVSKSIEEDEAIDEAIKDLWIWFGLAYVLMTIAIYILNANLPDLFYTYPMLKYQEFISSWIPMLSRLHSEPNYQPIHGFFYSCCWLLALVSLPYEIKLAWRLPLKLKFVIHMDDVSGFKLAFTALFWFAVCLIMFLVPLNIWFPRLSYTFNSLPAMGFHGFSYYFMILLSAHAAVFFVKYLMIKRNHPEGSQPPASTQNIEDRLR